MRIPTTHVGSLARPHDLLDMMKRGDAGPAYEARVRAAVADCVRKQAESGIDIVSDGEQSKKGFFIYVAERLQGFEARPGMKRKFFPLETAAFPEYYEQYFKQAMLGGTVAPVVPMVCTGPVRYGGQKVLQRDLENLRMAAKGRQAFMPSIAPSGVGSNEYYRTEEEYFHAVGAAMRTEYQAIVDAGFLLQVDDPFLSELFADPDYDARGKRRRAAMYVEAVNESLRGIPEEKVRFHTCYGINEGPRIHEAGLEDVIGSIVKVKAAQYSFEAANPRHEHEIGLWKKIRLKDGKKVIPGVITHASNIVEHPELIAWRLEQYAKVVGRDNVIAGADCGFSSQATYTPEVHPTVVWAKFAAMREGARLAGLRLWKKRGATGRRGTRRRA